MAMLHRFLSVTWNFKIFHDRLGPWSSVHENHRTCGTFPLARPKCLMRDFTNLNRIYKAHRTNVWCTIKVFRLHCRKMTHINKKCKEITLWPEIWWHDAVYHEVDHYLKWLRSANVRIFWSRPAEGAVILWTSCVVWIWRISSKWYPVSLMRLIKDYWYHFISWIKTCVKWRRICAAWNVYVLLVWGSTVMFTIKTYSNDWFKKLEVH